MAGTTTIAIAPEDLRRVADLLDDPDAAEIRALADRLEAEGRVTVERPAHAVTYVDPGPGRDRPPPAG